MTEKELLYTEDAIGHIGNITKLINYFIINLDDENLKIFMENELEKMTVLHNMLLDVLRGEANG